MTVGRDGLSRRIALTKTVPAAPTWCQRREMGSVDILVRLAMELTTDHRPPTTDHRPLLPHLTPLGTSGPARRSSPLS